MTTKQEAIDKKNYDKAVAYACERFSQVIHVFSSKYYIWPTYEDRLLEALGTAPDSASLQKRADFLIEYLEHVLPKQLEMIGSSIDAVKDRGPKWEKMITQRPRFEIVCNEDGIRIPIIDAFEMVYVVPHVMSLRSEFNSLWFCLEDSCVYIHCQADLSNVEKLELMTELRKYPKKEHPILWREKKPQGTPSTLTVSTDHLEQKEGKKKVQQKTQVEKEGEIAKSRRAANPLAIEILRCQVCYEYYDLQERHPMTLVPCGHSVCAQCIAETKACPSCHALYGIGIVTITLLNTLRAIQEGKFATLETKEMGQVTTIKEDRASSPMQGPPKGIENSEPPKDESGKETEIKTEPKKQKLVDKSKLIIRGLRNDMTIDEIVKELFQSPKGLLYYDTRPDISLRVEGESLTCQANFINREEATKAWFQCRCSIKDLHLTGTNVDYLEIGEEVQGIDGKEAGSSELSPEILLEKHVTLDRRSLFISGLPLRFSEDDVIAIIFQGKTHLDYSREGKPIILVSTGQAQNCVAHLIDEYVTQQCMMKWDTCLMENDRRLIVTYLGLASRELSKNYAKLEERRKSDKKSMEQEYDDTQKFLNDTIKYEKKLLISGFPNSFSRFDVMRALLSDGFEENAYANVYLKPMGVFQNALLYFKEESVAKELQKRWRGKSFGGGMQIILRLLDIDDSETYHEETIKGRLVDLGLHRSNLPHRPLPHVAPQKRFRDVRFPRERNPFKLFISGIPPSFHFWDIIEKIVGDEEEIATNEGKLSILIGDTLDGPKNCAVRFHTRRAADMVLNQTRDRVINKEFRLFAEYFGDAQRNFVYNYGTRLQ